jgi:hypothetical protein
MPKKRKKPGTRRLEKRLFIICEGMKDKSESAYFKSFIKSCKFKGDKVEVKVIDTNKNTGKELVKEAKNCKKEFPDDIAWVVYDKDGYTKHPETFDMAKNNNIKIAFSSISFEYWILIHYEYTSRPFEKSENIISYLNSNKYISYTKASTDIYMKTKSLMNTALANAKNIKDYQAKGNSVGTPVYNFNPYTNIDELIEEIIELQNI